MPDSDESKLSGGHYHPNNSSVVRGADGHWASDSLPVLDWESPAHRVVLPVALQDALHLPAPVLRWAREKVLEVQRSHDHPTEILQRQAIAERLDRWAYAGPQPGKANTWHVFFLEDGRWTLAVIGRDKAGSYNFVTMYRPTKGNLLANRIARGSYVVRQDADA